MFGSTNEFAPNQTEEILQTHEAGARKFILQSVPNKPDSILYEDLRLETLKRFIVKFSDVNQICKKLKNENLIEFPNWEKGKSVPHPHYLVQKP